MQGVSLLFFKMLCELQLSENKKTFFQIKGFFEEGLSLLWTENQNAVGGYSSIHIYIF